MKNNNLIQNYNNNYDNDILITHNFKDIVTIQPMAERYCDKPI